MSAPAPRRRDPRTRRCLLLALAVIAGCSADDDTTVIKLAHGLDTPHWLAMVVALMVVTYVPWLSLWLPRVFGYMGP